MLYLHPLFSFCCCFQPADPYRHAGVGLRCTPCLFASSSLDIITIYVITEK